MNTIPIIQSISTPCDSLIFALILLCRTSGAASEEETHDSDSQGGIEHATSALQSLLRRLGHFDDSLGMRGGRGRIFLFVSRPCLMSVSGSRFRQYLPDLNSGDDGRQMSALLELSDALSLGTEDSLLGFELDVFVPVLINLLNAEHNPDIMRTHLVLIPFRW